MMMSPEQQAELDAKARPLLEKLVEVLNELNEISEPAGMRVIADREEIGTAGGSVFYHPWTRTWQMRAQR